MLRYAIPFKSIEKVDECFRDLKNAGADVAIFGDDGEKFGLWPGTYDYVYDKEHWLESFFRYLTENASWLETVHFSGYIAATPRGKGMFTWRKATMGTGKGFSAVSISRTVGGRCGAT